MKKAIIIYYSHDGNTKKIAEAMAAHLHVDSMEIKPTDERKAKGFGKYFWGGYQVVMGKIPELEPLEKDISSYDMVFLGTPIWAGTYSPPIKTLLEGGIIKDKEVAFFCTHDGGPGKAIDKASGAIERNNTLVGTKDFPAPKKKMEACISEALIWAEQMIESDK
jgi:flavodoxin